MINNLKSSFITLWKLNPIGFLSSYRIYLVILLIILSFNCRKVDVPKDVVPILNTSDVTEISKTAALSGGNILSDGGSAIISRGVCWSNNNLPTVENSKTSDSTGIGLFTSNVSGLISGTQYYIRAYAINGIGIGYGDQRTFVTVGMVTDVDGNSYDTLKIGKQTWMVQNLRTTRFNDGTPIPIIADNTLWAGLITAAYCELENNISWVSSYGRLYNFYAAVDDKNICPNGWHIPSDLEWETLEAYVGGSDIAGGKLKSRNDWFAPNFGVESRTGFSALPGGFRDIDGKYKRVFYVNGEVMGNFGWWWTATESSGINSWARSMYSDLYGVVRRTKDKKSGLCIRCLKNE